MAERLDHGILNVPLSKRSHGSINAQIDRWKAEQARAARNERKRLAAETRALRAEAKAIVGSISVERLSEIAARKGLTAKRALKRLNQDAYWEPRKIIAEFGSDAAIAKAEGR